MTSERMPGVGLNAHKERWREAAIRRLQAQRSMRLMIQEAEIRRISQHVETMDDPEGFTSYPPDAEIPLGRAALSRLYHESTELGDAERANFAEQGLIVLTSRWERVGHAAMCNTGRRIVPGNTGGQWIPFTRG